LVCSDASPQLPCGAVAPHHVGDRELPYTSISHASEHLMVSLFDPLKAGAFTLKNRIVVSNGCRLSGHPRHLVG
jgi:hypothetical protein